MPPFYGNGMNNDGKYAKTSVDITIDFGQGDFFETTPRNFLYDAPLSHHWTLLQNFTHPDTTQKTNRSIEQYAYLEPILPGLIVSRSRTTHQIQHDPETLQWLSTQIAKLAPGKRPTAISFHWFRDQYDPNDLLNRQRELRGTTIIKL